MNEFEILSQMAKDIKARYPAGTRIEVISMENDPRPIESGTKGTVIRVDDMGTIHCEFDNGRQLGLIPNVDRFRKLTVEEINGEDYKAKANDFLDAVDEDIIPKFDSMKMSHAYQNGDMTFPLELLRLMCDDFYKVYNTNELNSDMGEIMVPGVVEACTGKIYPAIIAIDCAHHGEPKGTTIFSDSGIINDMSNNPFMEAEVEKFQPFSYFYAAKFDEDEYMDMDKMPEEAKDMFNEAMGEDIFNEGGMTY